MINVQGNYKSDVFTIIVIQCINYIYSYLSYFVVFVGGYPFVLGYPLVPRHRINQFRAEGRDYQYHIDNRWQKVTEKKPGDFCWNESETRRFPSELVYPLCFLQLYYFSNIYIMNNRFIQHFQAGGIINYCIQNNLFPFHETLEM